MQITVVPHSGFCFGVSRAVGTVEKLIGEGKKIYTFGKLIHNPDILDGLEKSGVRIAGDADVDALGTSETPVCVVFRAHGVTADIEEKLNGYAEKNENLTVVDCTCPYVKKIRGIVASPEYDGYIKLIFGEKDHPEVRGIASCASGIKHVFGSCGELEELSEVIKSELSSSKGIITVAQTTQNQKEYIKIKKIIENLFPNSIFFDTICKTSERQSETERIAKESDAMIIIGGRDSSNTKRLFEIARQYCEDTRFIESAGDLFSPDGKFIFEHIPEKIGIAAGASTPGNKIQEVINSMEEIKSTENFAQMLDESFKTLNTGDVVRGIVTLVTPAEVQVDIGAKVTGIMTLENVTNDPTAKLQDLFKVGDEIEAVAFRVSDVDGVAQLSKKKVDAENDWKAVESAFENKETLEGKVTEVTEKGASVIYRNCRIFVPMSQLPHRRIEDNMALANTVQKFVIIDIRDGRDGRKGRKSAIGSIRAITDMERREKINKFWDEIEEGKHYTGKVRTITSYGAFVDLGGVDGMVHTSELSWRRISSPKEVVSVGDTIEVFVKSFDREKNRISLGYKTEESNPWTIFKSKYSVGDVANVKVRSTLPFGAFAEIVPGVDGLIHISQLADAKVARAADVVTVGEYYDAKITEIDDEKQKVSLSIRALIEKPAEAPAADEPAETMIYSTDAPAAEKAEEAA
ncbi:MAG: 4-hydroxy-3-methylbut-2-enyl diphosphate reductase, partial [Clostridia bacterium]|nr:4-hydroxy-3-methylbut-2-enyl diphosphate reductase [Clostridia bacterium]